VIPPLDNTLTTPASSSKTTPPHVSTPPDNTSSSSSTVVSPSPLRPRPNLIDPDEFVHHEDIEDSNDTMDFENEKDFIVVTKPTNFALAAKIPDDPKKHPRDVIKMVNDAFLNLDSFKGANYRRVNLVRSIIVYFDNQHDMDDATNVVIQKDDYKLPPLEDYELYKTNMQFNAHTIHVSDLRLNL